MAAKPDVVPTMDNNPYVLVAAIDFGTKLTGYAFSFLSKPNEIEMNKNWGNELGHSSYKAPTCVLTGTDGKFVSFGYEAEIGYSNQQHFHLYRNFKMMLNQKNINEKCTITSTTGKERPALDIFAMALAYLKDHLIAAVKRTKVRTLDGTLIKWVLTVPAIWNDRAKIFMREAACKAGLITTRNSKQLVIALEPEVASMFCRSLQINHFTYGPEQTMETSYEPGDKYLVIDAGGGTVDITAHEISECGKVKEIMRPSGGAWGGMFTDNAFERYLQRIFGDNFIDFYKENHSRDWLNVMINFEKVKTTINVKNEDPINIQLSYKLATECSKFLGEDIEKVIEAKENLGIKLTNGQMQIDYLTAAGFIKGSVADIMTHINMLFQSEKMDDLDYIMLVGGFGQCQLLQQALLDFCKDKCVVLMPTQGQLAVLKGAVMFGHNPKYISHRIAKVTYGIGISEPFQYGVHNEKYKFFDDGEVKCKNIFDVRIVSGSEVKLHSKRIKSYTFTEYELVDGYATVSIYYANINPAGVLYTTDPGVTELGSVTLHLTPEDTTKTIIEVVLEVGGSELVLKARRASGGEEIETTVDFLSVTE